MKDLKNLGKALSTIEQKAINGGRQLCTAHYNCPPDQCCQFQDPWVSGLKTGFCGPLDNNTGQCNGELPFEP